jgi:hypothetical protein
MRQKVLGLEAEKADLRRRFGDAIALIGKQAYEIASLKIDLRTERAITEGYRRRDAEEDALLEVEGA